MHVRIWASETGSKKAKVDLVIFVSLYLGLLDLVDLVVLLDFVGILYLLDLLDFMGVWDY